MLPAEFSKKELAGILLKKEPPPVSANEAALLLIRDALKDGFTIRQLQIFNGIASNKTSRETGDDINLGERTVEEYRPGLFKTAGVESIFDLTLYGLRKGWIDKDGNKFLDDGLLKEFLKKKIK